MEYVVNNIHVCSDIELPFNVKKNNLVYYNKIYVKYDSNLKIPDKYLFEYKKNILTTVYIDNFYTFISIGDKVILKINEENIFFNNYSVYSRNAIISVGIATVLNFLGYSPIHSSGIINNNNIYLFSGTSGIGKSVIITHFLSNFPNIKFICDDLLPVNIYNDKMIPVGYNGLIKQWKENINKYDWLKDYLWEELIDGLDKYYTYIPNYSLDLNNANIKSIFYMEKSNLFNIERIDNITEKFKLILKLYYCNYLNQHTSFKINIKNASIIARDVNIYKMSVNNEVNYEKLENIIIGENNDFK